MNKAESGKRKAARILVDLLALAGLLAIVAGCGLWSLPLGLVVGGLAAIAAAVLGGLAAKQQEKQP